MLPIKPLDDQLFGDIVLRARRMIPRLTKQWTDENEHDPGITLLELLAYLKEMQQFHMDRVPEANLSKFLKLLGGTSASPRDARAFAWARACPALLKVPEGTPLMAGDIRFETLYAETLVPAEVSRIVTAAGGKVSVSEEVADVHEAFGADPQAGDEMFICLSGPLPAGERMRLDVELAPPKGGMRNPIGEDFAPLSTVEYAYSSEGGRWEPMHMQEDATHGFLQSGMIAFSLPAAMGACRGGIVDGEYALRCRLAHSEFDDAPRLMMLRLNMLPVSQRNTIARCVDLLATGAESRSYYLPYHLALAGSVDVLLGDGQGFRRMERRDEEHAGGFTVARKEGHALLSFAGTGVPAKDTPLRVLLSRGGMDALLIGRGDGLPRQRMPLSAEGMLMRDVLLMERHRNGLYYDYELVADFDASGPEDRHFVWDASAGEAAFGDGRNGRPPRGFIYAVRHVRTLGLAGNVKAGEICAFAREADIRPETAPNLYNPGHALGGSDGESTVEALSRFRAEHAHPTCAVTLADYEHIAKETPGLVIKRVSALASPPPGQAEIEGLNAVTVIIEPGGDAPRRSLSSAQRANVLRHLNRYRLVTTAVYAIAPEYVTLTVHCDVRAHARTLHPESIVLRALEEYFSGEWPFGKSVRYADLYGLLDTLECISQVRALAIDAQGRGVTVNAAGDVLLPPQGLVVLGECICRVAAR